MNAFPLPFASSEVERLLHAESCVSTTLDMNGFNFDLMGSIK